MNRAAATAVTLAHRATDAGPSRHWKRSADTSCCPRIPDFPPQLLDIPDPPTCLLPRETCRRWSCPPVAVVGSRDHSSMARRCVEGWRGAAAQAGRWWWSAGMARRTGTRWRMPGGAGGLTGLTNSGCSANGAWSQTNPYPSANLLRCTSGSQKGGSFSAEFPPGERPPAREAFRVAIGSSAGWRG
jgi:DNA processing protein